MKYQAHCLTSFLIMITFCLNTSLSQTSLNSFLNIPFGTKMETAKTLLLQKQGVKFTGERDHNSLSFTGLSIGAYKVDTCFLMESIFKGRFETSNLFFYSKAELLEEIYELHCAKYGNPTTSYTINNNVFYRWEFPVRGSKHMNSITLRSDSAADYFLLSYSGTGMLFPGWLQQYTQKTKNNTENF
jgi:hypothetical protein